MPPSRKGRRPWRLSRTIRDGSVRDAGEGAVLERRLEEEAPLAVAGTPQGQGEGVAEILGEVDLQRLPNLAGQIVEIGLVVLRQQDLGDSAPYGTEDLLLDAADRQHPAGEGDLAGHREVVLRLAAGEGGDHRGRHRDTRGGT